MLKKCKGCVNRKQCHDDLVSWFYFILGLIATVAIRIVVFLDPVNPVYAKIAWYVGVVGFVLFFLYKYRISHKRSKVIDDYELLSKMSAPSTLNTDDYERMRIILCSLTSYKDKINFAFIFFISALAIIWAVYVDFIKP